MKFVTLLTALLLVGCATPYQKQGAAGGYSETQLSENVFRVNFKGNGYTSSEKAEDYALLRSAELALEKGFSYFIIVDANSDISHSTYTAPVSSYTTGSVNRVGNTAYGKAKTHYTGGQTTNIRKPSSQNLIYCYKEKPDDQPMVYDANFLVKSLREKYKNEVK